MELSYSDTALFETAKSNFIDGQSKHVRFYEYYRDASLPRPFFFGEGNHTVYAISDPGIGSTLSQIDFESIKLNNIASIMESICSAILKIHVSECLYLDCKPDNFFFYINNKELQTKVCLFDFNTIVSIDDIKKGKNRFCSASYGWVPPEQELVVDPITGASNYNNPLHIGYHTDIYSIGAVFFWLLTQRRPDSEDIRSIQDGSFDWERESRYCFGADAEIIKTIQDIEASVLQPNTEIREKTFRQCIALKAILKQYESLYGLTAGDNIHFEPIHSILRQLEESFNDELNQVKTEIQNTSIDVQKAKLSIEESVRQYSVKETLFGSKRRTIATIGVVLIILCLFGFISAGINRATNYVMSTSSAELDQNIEDHILLKLSNANHQYEVGLENWRRLDYVRAERDILNSRNEVSEEKAQGEIEVAKINNSLGCLYLDMGRYSDAYDYLNSAYVTFRDQYGDDSIEARATRLSIAQYYYNTGKLEEALSEIQYILDNSDYASEKTIIVSTSHLRAMIFDAQGNYDEALNLYESVLRMYKDISENGSLQEQLANYANDPNLSQTEKDYYTNSIKWIVLTYNNIATVRIHEEDYDGAIDAANKGLELSLNNAYIGKRNLTTSRLYMNLAIAQGSSGELQSALDSVDLAMRIQRNLFDFEDVYPGLVNVYDVYGDLLIMNGDYQEAKDYYVNAVALAEESYGRNHPDTAWAYDYLGNYYVMSGDAESAIQYLSDSVEIRKNILADDHPETAKIYYDLSVAQKMAGDSEGAKESLIKAKQICEHWNIENRLCKNIYDLIEE